ncbi:MAG TPA: DMT family transporter [Aliiroseovarius sp.]|nr:DMT family transporter [Aliiroseovarius sp.]
MTLRQWGMILLTAALFGSSFFFIKLAVADLPPMTIAAGRALIAAMLVAAVARAFGAALPRPGRDWRPLVVVGILTAALPYALIAAGQTRIDSSLGGILFATIPLFSLFLSRAFLPDAPLSAGRIAGALTGLAGVALAIGPGALAGLPGQITGVAMTLAAAASYAAGAVYTRSLGRASPLVLAAGQLLVAAPLLAAAALLTERPWTLTPAPPALGAILAVGLVSTALPTLLFFRLVREVGPARASILTLFMPVFALLLGTLVLGERPGPAMFAGLVLILAGAILINRPRRAGAR